METKNYENRIEKAPTNAPQVCSTVREHISPASLETSNDLAENSMSCFHCLSGNTKETDIVFDVSMSDTERVFVLGMDGKPLTPCKKGKARKMIFGGVARIIWNKFGNFGVQMLIPTRKHTPKTVMGMDWGSKFEGYSVIVDNDNSFNVMWLLPDKKKLVRKLKERSQLRRARRFRNCRRREARYNNRSRDGFIAPSQLQIVQSRLKCIKELIKSYPISKVAVEDVKFNHRDYKFGKHFSTVEVGKNKIYNYIIENVGRENLIKFEGTETYALREKFGLKKSETKNKQAFDSHCVDSFVIACEISFANPNFKIKIVDDRYKPARRSLYDTQPANGKNLERQKKAEQNGKFTGFKKEGGYFAKYSNGNFKGIRKGTIFELGQIIGGTGKSVYYQDWDGTSQKGKSLKKIGWYSKQFKWRNSPSHLLPKQEVSGRSLIGSNYG